MATAATDGLAARMPGEALAALVTSVPLFQGLHANVGALSALVGALRPRTYAKGDLIVEKGALSGEMFFLMRGDVEIDTTADTATGRRRKLVAPSFFGESGLLMSEERQIFVRALSASVQIFVLEKADLLDLVGRVPEINQSILVSEAVEDRQQFSRRHQTRTVKVGNSIARVFSELESTEWAQATSYNARNPTKREDS